MFVDVQLLKLYSHNCLLSYRPVGRAVTRSSLEREVRGSNLGPDKSDTLLPTARHRCDIFVKGAVLPGRYDAEMGPANSLHASAYYSEYNETSDLNCLSSSFKIPIYLQGNHYLSKSLNQWQARTNAL